MAEGKEEKWGERAPTTFKLLDSVEVDNWGMPRRVNKENHNDDLVSPHLEEMGGMGLYLSTLLKWFDLCVSVSRAISYFSPLNPLKLPSRFTHTACISAIFLLSILASQNNCTMFLSLVPFPKLFPFIFLPSQSFVFLFVFFLIRHIYFPGVNLLKLRWSSTTQQGNFGSHLRKLL